MLSSGRRCVVSENVIAIFYRLVARKALFMQRLVAGFAVCEVGVPSVLFRRWRGRMAAGSNFLVDVTSGNGSAAGNAPTSPRGNPGAAEGLKREKRK